jgi:uncharacterized protein YbjT (DUF2867 family)
MIVITGATGNVGRPLVAALAEAGERVTAVSRRADAWAPPGVLHRQADLAEPDTLRPVLDGAEALFLLVSGAGAHLRPAEILDVARSGGVRRIVLLSSQAAGTRPDSPSHAPLRVLEDAVRQSGPAWTVLRAGGFATNAFAWAEQVRAQRTVAAPFGDVGLPVLDPLDIAEVAAAVLRKGPEDYDGGEHNGRTYELTGPEALTPRERVQAIADALGEPVRFVEQDPEEARAQMLRFMPEPVADGTLEILGRPLPAERLVSPHIEEVLGRPAGTFAAWARRNVTAFK